MRYGLLCLILAAGLVPAQAQDADAPATPKARPAAAKAVKPPAAKLPAAKPVLASASKELPKIETTGALSQSTTGLSVAERGAIQAALAWSGDYTGAASNGDDPFVAAIKTFQKRSNAKVTGELSAQERATLLAAAARHEEEFGWRVIDDAATGARIGVPTKKLPIVTEQRNGTRWTARHGDLILESFRTQNPDITLTSLFERQKKEPAGRKIEYSLLRGDSFFISGMQGLKKFAVRAFAKDGELRGFTVLFDQAMEGVVAPVTTAIASTYVAFPPPSMMLAAATPKRVEYTTGVVVSANGYMLAGRHATEGCNVIVAASLGPAERIAEDKNADLALLRVYGARNLTALPLAGEAASSGDVSVIGVPDPQNGDSTPTAINAKLSIGGMTATLQPVPGLPGAAVVDREGRFAGLVGTQNSVVASVTASVPQPGVITSQAVKAFLGNNGVALASGKSSIETAKSAAVRIICVRK
ncbi:MAG TPA: serine protease [Pseudolabrys sp.]|nr:serine protease [Pseudolabrys sp.]